MEQQPNLSRQTHSAADSADTAADLDDRLVADLRPRAFRLALRILADPWAADDVAQDAMLKLLTAAPLRRPAALRSWVLTVTRNLAIDQLHRARRDPGAARDFTAPTPQFDLPAAVETPLQLVAATETRVRLRDAIDALPAPRREVLRLCVDHGLDQATAAARLGIPKATVNSRMARAREFLRGALSRDVG